MTLALHQDSDDIIDPEEERFTSDASHVTDGVKLYLRDIGRIPLLNKETEKIIANTAPVQYPEPSPEYCDPTSCMFRRYLQRPM